MSKPYDRKTDARGLARFAQLPLPRPKELVAVRAGPDRAIVGSVYALVAVAFTLAIGVLNFLNFSIPGLFMVAGMLTWFFLRAGVACCDARSALPRSTAAPLCASIAARSCTLPARGMRLHWRG